METLSTSVSTFNVPSLHPSSSRNLYPPSTSHQLHLLHHSSTSKPNSKPSPKTLNPQISPFKPLNLPRNFPQFSSPTPTHTNPITGYAAALINILQSNNHSLDSAVKDARRFSKVLREDGIVSILSNSGLSEKEKGRVIKEVGRIGKFNGFLVRLMKMLIEKKKKGDDNNLGVLKQVLVEFERICDELNGIEVVMVSSKKKMEEKEVFGIARRVQKVSGALQVKVRNFIDDYDDGNLLSFAV